MKRFKFYAKLTTKIESDKMVTENLEQRRQIYHKKYKYDFTVFLKSLIFQQNGKNLKFQIVVYSKIQNYTVFQFTIKLTEECPKTELSNTNVW